MKWFLTVTAVIFAVAGMIMGYLEHTTLLIGGLISGLTLLVFANLDRIAEFKASRSGIEARTRDVVARAETALSELQLLATHVAELTLSIVKRQGRLGGYSDREQNRIEQSVISILEKLGVSQSQIDAAHIDWHRVNQFDYAYYILGQSRPGDPGTEIGEEWNALRQGGLEGAPSPKAVRVFLTKHGLLSADRELLLQDYEYYCANHAHRRPAVWDDRGNWGSLRRAQAG